MKRQDKQQRCTKVKHRSEWAASKHVAALEKDQKQKLFTYYCEICGAWHVGHSANRGVFVPKIDRIFNKLENLGNDPQEPAPIYWWLSFRKPVARGHNVYENLGVIIVCSATFYDAVNLASSQGTHPGGEVRGFCIPPEHVPPEAFHNRLLTKADLNAMEPDDEY
jgi:hypothetical protein